MILKEFVEEMVKKLCKRLNACIADRGMFSSVIAESWRCVTARAPVTLSCWRFIKDRRSRPCTAHKRLPRAWIPSRWRKYRGSTSAAHARCQTHRFRVLPRGKPIRSVMLNASKYKPSWVSKWTSLCYNIFINSLMSKCSVSHNDSFTF